MRVLPLLANKFPETFAVWEARRKPLKVGIGADIAGLGVLPPRELRHALAYYCGSLGYLCRMLCGAVRVDLGAP
jgi:sRNA-binding protein